jgi:methenyltetrahydromethanopterin cyclohydrolase
VAFSNVQVGHVAAHEASCDGTRSVCLAVILMVVSHSPGKVILASRKAGMSTPGESVSALVSGPAQEGLSVHSKEVV